MLTATGRITSVCVKMNGDREGGGMSAVELPAVLREKIEGARRARERGRG